MILEKNSTRILQKSLPIWAVVFLVVWGVYTGRTRLRHAYAVGFYQGFGLRGV